MRVSTRFPIAVHALVLIATFSDKLKMTSDVIAGSTGCNAVSIRNILGTLKKAGIVSIAPGTGGAALQREPKDINLWQIYTVIEKTSADDIFKFHPNSSDVCPVGKNMYSLLSRHCEEIVDAMEKTMSKTSLQQLLDEMNIGVI
ncbi:Rrf2 family transcriptional regulator [Desulfosporosinus metallidurans]|nr:Rrf2 family transcriptional regulator [Desulfosporosinus metallidurans]